jgi:Helix-turn-helix domain
MQCYSHLSDDERERIGLAKALGHSIGAIAQAIGRPKSTVWRELSRNRLPSGRYSPLHAAGQANRPISYGVISRAGTNAAARADRDLRKIPSRIASPSTNGPRRSTPEPRAATGRVTSSFVSVHGQCSFSMRPQPPPMWPPM